MVTVPRPGVQHIARPLFQRSPAPPVGRRGGRMGATVCEPPVNVDAQASMKKDQKMLMKSLKDKTKQMKKLSKQIMKAPADKKVTLALEMKKVITTIEADNDNLVRLAMRMAEQGYEDPDSGSSSDEDAPQEVVAAADQGVTQLLSLEKGLVNVCTGKACTRKGGSEQILSALTSRWKDNPDIDVQECSCMSMCKLAANVSMRVADTNTVVTGMKPEMLTEQQAKERVLELSW